MTRQILQTRRCAHLKSRTLNTDRIKTYVAVGKGAHEVSVGYAAQMRRVDGLELLSELLHLQRAQCVRHHLHRHLGQRIRLGKHLETAERDIRTKNEFASTKIKENASAIGLHKTNSEPLTYPEALKNTKHRQKLKVIIPLQDARELVSVAHQSTTLAVLLLLRRHHIEVRRLHGGIPGIERSTGDERVVQGVA